MSKPNREHDVIAALIHNHQEFKGLCSPHIKLRDELMKSEDVIFHPVIEKQYKETIRLVLSIELQKKIGVDHEDVRSVLDNLNWNDYFNV